MSGLAVLSGEVSRFARQLGIALVTILRTSAGKGCSRQRGQARVHGRARLASANARPCCAGWCCMSFLSRQPGRRDSRSGDAGRDDEYDSYDDYAPDGYANEDDGWSPGEYFSPEGIKGK